MSTAKSTAKSVAKSRVLYAAVLFSVTLLAQAEINLAAQLRWRRTSRWASWPTA
jgi:hypothetical protein